MSGNEEFIKDRGKRIVPLLEEVYGNMTHDDLMVSAYQLMHISPENLLNWKYGHIVFEDLNLNRDAIQFCIDHIVKPDDVYEDLHCTFNIQVLELLICLKHMLLKDRIKVIFNDIDEDAMRLNDIDSLTENGYTEVAEEYRMMHNAGYTDPKELMEERAEELEEYKTLGLIDYEVADTYVYP